MRFYASVAYDGSHFCGFQTQPNGCAVQDQLESVFSEYFDQAIRIAAVSRTDAGVHALDQRIEWEVDTPVPPHRFPAIFNRRLRHIRLHWADFAPPHFSARRRCCYKRYCYKLRFGPQQPFLEPYYWCLSAMPIRLTALQEVLSLFVGDHNFRYFCKIDKTKPELNFLRYVESVSVTAVSEFEWHVHVTGRAFLWKMVRYLVAAGLYCLRGHLSVSEIKTLLQDQWPADKKRPSITPAPAQGLYLEEVILVS